MSRSVYLLSQDGLSRAASQLIASIVMVESSGEGITFAAPRTKTIYEAYLNTELMNED